MLVGALRTSLPIHRPLQIATNVGFRAFSHSSRVISAQRAAAPAILSCVKASWSLGRLGAAPIPFPAVIPRETPSNTRFVHQNRPLLDQAQSTTPEIALPILPSPAVGRWLLLSSILVLGIIVVGGVTRLTESGLSITEWQPITGILPPLSHDESMVEFDKYKATPEFKLCVCFLRARNVARVYDFLSE